MISAIATIQDGSCRCVHFDFNESTSWDALKKRLSTVLGAPLPFTVSYLDDNGEDIAITAAEWPTTSASAASTNNFLVLNVTPVDAPAPEAPKEEERQRPQFAGRCGNGRGFSGFPFGCNFSKVQEACQAMGLEKGDMQSLVEGFLNGAPLPEQKVQGIAKGLSSLTGRPEEVISAHVKEAYSKGQGIASQCKKDAEEFASNARAYAASVAEAAAAAELAAEEERQAREKANATKPPVATEKPSSSASSRVRHPAACDVCKKAIVGVRMKCLNCEDYDMCEDCEQRDPVEHLHVDGHVFAKIYKPSFLRFAEPFPNLYEAAANQRRAAAVRRRAGSEEKAAAAQQLAEEKQRRILTAKREWMEKRRAAAEAAAKAATAEDSRLASLEQKLLQLTEALAKEKAAREQTSCA